MRLLEGIWGKEETYHRPAGVDEKAVVMKMHWK
jgi:hypothetical protein